MIKRREFIAGLGSAAAWPVVARAQQPAVPVIGFLSAQSAEVDYKEVTVPFLQGLKESGYVEGQNVAVEYRYAENQLDRLPALAADLVHRRVAVIVAAGGSAAVPAGYLDGQNVTVEYHWLEGQYDRLPALVADLVRRRVALIAMPANTPGAIAASVNELWHWAGAYTGRILKGEKPADLPVVQPIKFELVINLKTAKALGLSIPETLLATADEVIE